MNIYEHIMIIHNSYIHIKNDIMRRTLYILSIFSRNDFTNKRQLGRLDLFVLFAMCELVIFFANQSHHIKPEWTIVCSELGTEESYPRLVSLHLTSIFGNVAPFGWSSHQELLVQRQRAAILVSGAAVHFVPCRGLKWKMTSKAQQDQRKKELQKLLLQTLAVDSGS